MKTVPLTKSDIESLPIHDAQLTAIVLQPCASGDIRVQLSIRLHEEEPLDALNRLGLRSDAFVVTFEACWQIKINFVCHATTEHLISSWSVSTVSGFVERLKAEGLAKKARPLEHKLEFCTGSYIEIVSERVTIEETI